MNKKIGIIDSGIGGLITLSKLQKQYNNVDFMFIADYEYSPYGTKDRDVIKKRVIELVNFLKTRVDCILIACNTASIFVDEINIELPIYGVINSTTKYFSDHKISPIGILATDKTIDSQVYENKLLELGIYSMGIKSSDIVSLIEADQHETLEAIKLYEKK